MPLGAIVTDRRPGERGRPEAGSNNARKLLLPARLRVLRTCSEHPTTVTNWNSNTKGLMILESAPFGLVGESRGSPFRYEVKERSFDAHEAPFSSVAHTVRSCCLRRDRTASGADGYGNDYGSGDGPEQRACAGREDHGNGYGARHAVHDDVESGRPLYAFERARGHVRREGGERGLPDRNAVEPGPAIEPGSEA